MRDKLIDLVKGKRVHIATHWDADGVSSGALMYHLIRPYAKSITKISKGKAFLIEPEDIDRDAEVVICTDIQPSGAVKELPAHPKIVYIDHHPSDSLDYDLVVHDPDAVSASILIYDNFFQDTEDPYIIFLTLLGYFGDRGQVIPVFLEDKAKRLLGGLLELQPSSFGRPFYELERFVSLVNTGKRINWSGNEPLELMTSVSRIEAMFTHEIFARLYSYKQELRDAYRTDVEVANVGKIDFVFLSSPKNIQGVIAARKMGSKPILVVNNYDNELIGSMRVPDNLDFDAGAFLSRFNGKISGYLGGGHEKAGGFNLSASKFDEFVGLLKEFAAN